MLLDNVAAGKKVTPRTILTGLSLLSHKASVIIYSQVVHQRPGSGIRRFRSGLSLLSPILKFLGNAFTGERIFQRPAPLISSSVATKHFASVISISISIPISSFRFRF